MSKGATKGRRAIPDDYLELVRRFPLRPIRDESEYDEAAAVLETLVGRDDLSPGQSDYLEALTTFIEAYDEEHYPIEAPEMEPHEWLKELMENAGMSLADLAKLLGSKGAASETLSGRRPMSRVTIFKLAERFNVDPARFLAKPKRAARS
jgi:HTH-type transcriptional regulator/antitoxin HigA